jgi:hypothetical protein
MDGCGDGDEEEDKISSVGDGDGDGDGDDTGGSESDIFGTTIGIIAACCASLGFI